MLKNSLFALHFELPVAFWIAFSELTDGGLILTAARSRPARPGRGLTAAIPPARNFG